MASSHQPLKTTRAQRRKSSHMSSTSMSRPLELRTTQHHSSLPRSGGGGTPMYHLAVAAKKAESKALKQYQQAPPKTKKHTQVQQKTKAKKHVDSDSEVTDSSEEQVDSDLWPTAQTQDNVGGGQTQMQVKPKPKAKPQDEAKEKAHHKKEEESSASGAGSSVCEDNQQEEDCKSEPVQPCSTSNQCRPAAVEPVSEGPLRDFTNLIVNPTIGGNVGCNSCLNYSRYTTVDGHIFSYVVDENGTEWQMYYPSCKTDPWFIWTTAHGRNVCYFVKGTWQTDECGRCYVEASRQSSRDKSKCRTKEFFQEQKEYQIVLSKKALSKISANCLLPWSSFAFWNREVFQYQVINSPGNVASALAAWLVVTNDISAMIVAQFNSTTEQQAQTAIVATQLTAFVNGLAALGAAIVSGDSATISAALAALASIINLLTLALAALCNNWRASWMTRVFNQYVVLAQAEATALLNGTPTDGVAAFTPMLQQSLLIGQDICAGLNCCGGSCGC